MITILTVIVTIIIVIRTMMMVLATATENYNLIGFLQCLTRGRPGAQPGSGPQDHIKIRIRLVCYAMVWYSMV